MSGESSPFIECLEGRSKPGAGNIRPRRMTE